MKEVEIPSEIENKEKFRLFEMEISQFSNHSLIESEEEITKKTIPTIERMVRNSYEYRQYIQYLKTELDLTKCSFIEKLDINDTDISLEFHHFPLNLYEICEAVLKSKISNLTSDDLGVSLFDVAEEVVAEHYRNEIGLVPLSKTLHEMAHNRAIFISMDKVYGSYKTFINRYRQFIDKDVLSRVEEAENYNGIDEVVEYNERKLQKEITKFQISYAN